jgi:hypothetical protein
MVADVKKAAEVLSTNLVDKPKPRGQQPKHGIAKKTVAEALGVSTSAVVRTEQHAETAQDFPFMQGENWRQHHVIEARSILQRMPGDNLARTTWSMNGTRRDLTPSQRAAMAVVLMPFLEQEAAERQVAAGKQQAARGAEGGRGKKKPLTQKVESRVSERNETTAAAVAAATVGTNRQYVAEAGVPHPGGDR